MEDRQREAERLTSEVGKQAYCYFIGSIPYRGDRRDIFQCEVGATNTVDCYVRFRGRPVKVDALLDRKAAYEALEESAIEKIGCIGPEVG